MVSLEEALECGVAHLTSIDDSWKTFGEYTLPECWISEEVVKGLREALDALKERILVDEIMEEPSNE